MRIDEYETMARVEKSHWWYKGLRRIVLDHWRWYVLPGSRKVRGSNPMRVLDAGCGTGTVLWSLEQSACTVGVDCSPVAIGFCRSQQLQRTAVASVAKLPFGDASFDVVISCDVLCHAAITDCTAAMGEMARVLKPGGLLMLNLPAYQWLLSTHDAAVANVRRFSRVEVLRLLQEQSLTPLRVTFWNSLLFFPIAAVRLGRGSRRRQQSDLHGPAFGHAILFFILSLERLLLRFVPSLPFGLSLFAVARKA